MHLFYEFLKCKYFDKIEFNRKATTKGNNTRNQFIGRKISVICNIKQDSLDS